MITRSLSMPKLNDSMLAFRLGMVRKRLSAYPMDRMDFIMMDLERPEKSSRHAHWCTGDCTGRTLEFLSYSQGIDGKCDERIDELFMRMIRQKRPSGLFGRGNSSPNMVSPEEDPLSGCGKEFPAFLRYYIYSGDVRALEAARGIADYKIAHKDEFLAVLDSRQVNGIESWTTEHFALMYDATKDPKYLDMVREIQKRIGSINHAHSHGFLTTMRGLQQAAISTGDMSWNEIPEKFRHIIIEEKMEMVDGCICECFPRSSRNEGCSVADWIMLNLNSGYLNDDDNAYEKAEHILYNALFFNQIITGGLIQRNLQPYGYGCEVQEAWWCCTQTGGLAMSMFARHCVTRSENMVRINFLVPGEYLLPNLPSPIKVFISTNWPKTAEAVIRVENLPTDMQIHIRIPAGVHKWTCLKEEIINGCIIRTSGEMGHYVEACGNNKYTIKYGPMILAPTVYKWGHIDSNPEDSTVPEGYIPGDYPSMNCSIVIPEKNANGFLEFQHLPFPDWTYYEEGPESKVDLGDASVNVNLSFQDGSVKEARFWPLCQTFGSLCIYETPIVFSIQE